jgi:hypothetical protein
MYKTPSIILLSFEEDRNEMRINCQEPNYCSYIKTFDIPGGDQCAIGCRYCAMTFLYHPSICPIGQTYHGG